MVLLAVALGAWLVLREARTDQLRERFGQEYDRTVDAEGGRRQAEAELRDRMKRHEELEIRPLSPEATRRYTDGWSDVQAWFVDDPGGSLRRADQLITEVLRERGYPTGDFDQRSADLSVDHADVMGRYRAAHETSIASDRGHASTEDIRRAMIDYRALFERLVEAEDRATSYP